MRVLMLGGTRFFGKEAVKKLIELGYDVTIATRGISKDTFGDQVSRVVLNREDRNSMEAALKDTYYDVVYDNICYAPDDVKNLIEVMGNNIGKYIVTSSLAVYDPGYNLDEAAFDPYHYPITYGDRRQYSYGEGKRLVEAVAYQHYNVPTIAVRFPVVIGKNDYTQRLRYYVEQVVNQTPFVAKGAQEPMSFITEEDAGSFLALLATSDFVGPVNGSSRGNICVQELLELIEEHTGEKPILIEDGKNIGPYSAYGNVTLDCTKAEALGMRFSSTEEAFKTLIAFECDHLKEE